MVTVSVAVLPAPSVIVTVAFSGAVGTSRTILVPSTSALPSSNDQWAASTS
jgi:hypothetical protein